MNDSLEKEEAGWYTSLLSEGNMIHGIKISHSLPELVTRFKLACCLFIVIFTACTQYKSAEYYQYYM